MANLELVNKIKIRLRSVLGRLNTHDSNSEKLNWCWGYVVSMRENDLINEDELNDLYLYIDKMVQ